MKKLIISVMVVMLSACANITLEKPALLSPFGDGTQWVVWEDMEFTVELDDKSITSIKVPRGFVTDLASTPRLLWSKYPPFGKYLSASVLHDYLYWHQICKKEEADKIFYQAMRDAGVDQTTQALFFLALKEEGGRAWDMNKNERATGLVRVIPEKLLEQRNTSKSAATSWNEYRELLHKQNVHEETQPSDELISKVCPALTHEIKVKTGFMSVVLGRQ